MFKLNPNTTHLVEDLLLKEKDLHITDIADRCNKFKEWLSLQLDTENGRQTRSTIRKAEKLYNEILEFKANPIPFERRSKDAESIKLDSGHRNNSNSSTNSIISQQSQPARILRSRKQSSDLDSDDDSASLRPITRSLRQRCRTPQQNNQPSTNGKLNTRKVTSPTTPQNQRIRPNLLQIPGSGGSSNCGKLDVLSAALNQQHPSVSVTKIRQLLRADSAQKKQVEQLERNEKLMLSRKNKEERAEALKKQLLEERAVKAKLKREQRLNNAAELRKQREDAKIQQRIQEEKAKLQAQLKGKKQKTDKPPTYQVEANKNDVQPESVHVIHPKPNTVTEPQVVTSIANTQQTKPNNIPSETKDSGNQIKSQPGASTKIEQPVSNKLNETFKKPNVDQIDNIDISIKDETTEEDHREKVQPIASWTEKGVFRQALIKQFDKSDVERQSDIRKIFPKVKMPIQLEKIFPSNRIVNAKYMVRTSSAVWTPPNKGLKRTSSVVLTPNANNP